MGTNDGTLIIGEPAYEEAHLMASFRIKITAHASPRWRGAANPREASQKNLELSRKRANQVRRIIEETLLATLGSLTSVQFKMDIKELDGSLGIEEDSRGSQETIREARGNLSDNSQKHRRVDVIIDLHQHVVGESRGSKQPDYRTVASRFWHVSVDMNAGASFGGAGQYLQLRIINDLTSRVMNAHVWSGGGGPKASIGASKSIWGDPTGFYTDDPKTFHDFSQAIVRYTTVGLNLFIGYEKSYISFIGFGRGAQSIDVGGFNVGTVGIGGSVTAGGVTAEGIPSDKVAIDGSEIARTPYQRSEGGKFEHQVLFATQQDALSSVEQDLLKSVVQSAIASSRN